MITLIQFGLLVIAIFTVFIIYRLNYKTESFTDTDKDIIKFTPDFTENWNLFIKLQNEIMKNWKEAIVTSIHLDAPKTELTSPSKSPLVQPTLNEPSIDDINKYITTLSGTEKIDLPKYVEIEPTIQTTIKNGIIPYSKISETLTELNTIIPQTATLYINALNWMNTKMSASHDDLQNAMKGIETFYSQKTTWEGYESNKNICQQLTDCQKESISDYIKQFDKITTQLIEINKNQELATALALNRDLSAKSKDIQNKAVNGELINVKVKELQKYEMPSDFDKYKNNMFYFIKQNIEEINRNL
jgi:hypothetical protein